MSSFLLFVISQELFCSHPTLWQNFSRIISRLFNLPSSSAWSDLVRFSELKSGLRNLTKSDLYPSIWSSRVSLLPPPSPVHCSGRHMNDDPSLSGYLAVWSGTRSRSRRRFFWEWYAFDGGDCSGKKAQFYPRNQSQNIRNSPKWPKNHNKTRLLPKKMQRRGLQWRSQIE